MSADKTLTRLWIASLRCHIWGVQGSSSPKVAAMRLIAAACTLVIVAFLAVFGAILLHERTNADIAQAGQPGATAVSGPSAEPVGLSTSPITTLASASRGALVPEPQAVAPQERPPSQTFAQGPARPAAPAGAAPPPPASTVSCPGNPNALGIGRVVEVDTTGGPGFGFEHFKAH